MKILIFLSRVLYTYICTYIYRVYKTLKLWLVFTWFTHVSRCRKYDVLFLQFVGEATNNYYLDVFFSKSLTAAPCIHNMCIIILLFIIILHVPQAHRIGFQWFDYIIIILAG